MSKHTFDRGGQPGYLQIADDLRAQIRSGDLAAGSALPSTAQLAERYEAAMSVVKMAVAILRNEGLVIGQQGRGVFVHEADAADPAAASAVDLAAILAEVRQLAERVTRIETTLAEIVEGERS